MGISRSNAHKRKATGGKKRRHEKKRKHNSGRAPSNTKIGPTKVKPMRVRGGNIKRRALRLNSGSFTCKSLNVTKSCAIAQVMYHPTNNELMRTNTLTRSAIVKIDGTGFKEVLSGDDGFKEGAYYARITSRPGQDGAADGYLLEGAELSFYMDKFKKRKGE
ncbi:ribosomal protein S8.e [Vavraia culicis subsp. floridensis]|uniref:40S ribosomal protein S8 n=1 Tax=Vavraia culicis (isolate floridensis) TaxID=948595 RepID=L2GSX2_VAVCU|nr:ribosomal protein S8.e [Vavraia culicis subsp. floridensis]ELA46457.1 ribosomal protein S8.e [Vavraia culicis subsp. floridensis]